MSFDSASVPKFDSQKLFKVWYRKWLDFCIGKRWESLYETGARGVYRMPVINDEGETGVRNNEVRDSDRRIVWSALLGAFDEARSLTKMRIHSLLHCALSKIWSGGTTRGQNSALNAFFTKCKWSAKTSIDCRTALKLSFG